MTEVPKIVHNRLRVAGEASQGRPHPEGDLLAAFAEQALNSSERNGVLQHLSLCEDCRDAVVLALPAEAASALRPMETEADHAALIPAIANRSWLNLGSFAWPTLRWAALAAGIAVAASVLLLHPAKPNRATRTSVQVPVTSVAAEIGNSRSSQSSKEQASTVATDAPGTSPNALVANNQFANKLANNKKQSSASDETRAKLLATPVANQPSSAVQSMAVQSMNENVEASEAPTSALTPSPENTLMARNDAPAIEKAKPVPQEIETEASSLQTSNGAPAAAKAMMQIRNAGAMPVSRDAIRNVSWAITAGVLQRSLDSGQTWQNALHADHPLLCYANLNDELWAGGEKGELFHSVDSGLTWARLQPSVNAHQLTGDITNIEVLGSDSHRDPHDVKEIVVTTSTNEVWSSPDSGKTWNKK